MGGKFPDAVWEVVKVHLRERKGIKASDEMREIVEQHTEIELFDGGAFVAYGNEFDLFVVPEKRGRWRIRSIVKDYLDRMGQRHGTIVVKIEDDNAPSLRLAKHFGFQEVSRQGKVVRLEKNHG